MQSLTHSHTMVMHTSVSQATFGTFVPIFWEEVHPAGRSMATSPPLWLLLLNIISEMVHSTEQKHAPSKNSGTSTLMSLISRYISVESGDSSCIKLFMSAFLLTSLSSPQFNGFPNVSHEEQSLRLNGLCPESAAQDEKNIAAISTVFMINIWFFLEPERLPYQRVDIKAWPWSLRCGTTFAIFSSHHSAAAEASNGKNGPCFFHVSFLSWIFLHLTFQPLVNDPFSPRLKNTFHSQEDGGLLCAYLASLNIYIYFMWGRWHEMHHLVRGKWGNVPWQNVTSMTQKIKTSATLGLTITFIEIDIDLGFFLKCCKLPQIRM